MAVNLIVNARDALKGFPVGELHGWLDSTVALYWIQGSGEYKQFVSNRVHQIQRHSDVKWHHVSSRENPADLGSRGGSVEKEDLRWKGPMWLANRESWPCDIVISATAESKAEMKVPKEVFAGALEKTDELDMLLKKFTLWKTLRICAWMSRFVRNARGRKGQRVTGPLTSEEIGCQRMFWEKRAQRSVEGTSKFEADRLQLNLQKRNDGLLECRGRIQGDFPIYLPDSHQYTEKLLMGSHLITLHGGVGLTMAMAKVREKYWVPRLRRLAKKTIKCCFGCKRFQATALARPPPGNLPRDRTEGNVAYKVVGVDFAGPLKYRKGKKQEGKAYIILYACCVTRGIYLELLPNQEMDEFLRSLKRFIARRGRPTKIYSDNGRTFVGATNWLRRIMKNERLNDWLAKHEIRWQFNVSRAPWWGGQFERMVGLVKQSLYKTINNSLLTWNELQDVLLDIEIALNDRPLSYVEDDVQLPILTPNSLLTGRSILPEEDESDIEDVDLRRRAKYLQRCKDLLWKRWSSEYLKALRERHNLGRHNNMEKAFKVGDVVIIKSDERNRNKWKLGIVEQLIPGRDNVVRVAKLRAGKNILERPVQHLYPLELSCDRGTPVVQRELNGDTPVVRPRRDAATAARMRIQEIAAAEEEES